MMWDSMIAMDAGLSVEASWMWIGIRIQWLVLDGYSGNMLCESASWNVEMWRTRQLILCYCLVCWRPACRYRYMCWSVHLQYQLVCRGIVWIGRNVLQMWCVEEMGYDAVWSLLFVFERTIDVYCLLQLDPDEVCVNDECFVWMFCCADWCDHECGTCMTSHECGTVCMSCAKQYCCLFLIIQFCSSALFSMWWNLLLIGFLWLWSSYIMVLASHFLVSSVTSREETNRPVSRNWVEKTASQSNNG